jgi:hypothetical protein
LSGLVGIVAGTAACFVLASPLRRLGSGYRTYSLACGIAIVICLAAFLLGLFSAFPGFGQRLGATIGFAWMVVIAVGILRDREPSLETP